MPQQQGAGIAQQTRENSTHGVCGLAGELAAGGGANVGNGPATNYRVKRQNQEACKNAHGANQFPGRVQSVPLGNGLDAVNRAVATTTADHHLGHHDGNTDDGDTQQVHQHKSATAVFAGYVGEFPDVSEAHSGTGGREDEREP